MTMLTLREALGLFLEHHIYVDDVLINEIVIEDWLRSGELKGVQQPDGRWEISKDEIERYIYALQWEGTAYEEGIDDKTRIERLREQIYELTKQIEELKRENYELKDRLGISDIL